MIILTVITRLILAGIFLIGVSVVWAMIVEVMDKERLATPASLLLKIKTGGDARPKHPCIYPPHYHWTNVSPLLRHLRQHPERNKVPDFKLDYTITITVFAENAEGAVIIAEGYSFDDWEVVDNEITTLTDPTE